MEYRQLYWRGERLNGGQGSYVDISMLDCSVAAAQAQLGSVACKIPAQGNRNQSFSDNLGVMDTGWSLLV